MSRSPDSGLVDRLYADALAAALAPRESFLRARCCITSEEIVQHARLRGEVYVSDLRVSPAGIQRSWKQVNSRFLARSIKPRIVVGGIRNDQHRIVDQLTHAATSLLQTDGPNMVLKVERDEPGREILRWRFVTLALPASILVAAATPPGRRVPAVVRLLHPAMAPDHDVAHQHLHHAAMVSFEELWASLRLRALLEPGDFHRSLRHKLAWCPGLHNGPCLRTKENGKEQAERQPEESAKHMAEWGDTLCNAFIARGLLDRHAGHPALLDECQHLGCETGRTTLRHFMRGRGRPYSLTGTPYPWPSDRFRLARDYWDANAVGVFTRTQKKRRTFIREQTAEERSILARAFNHLRLREEEPHDEQYEILFLQYLRVKTALHGLLVHPTGEHGLANFLHHFSQIKIYEPRSDRLRPGKPDDPGLIVAATEYRVAPDAWLAQLGRGERDIRGKKRTIEELFPGEKAGEAAWLIHFKRKEHSKKLLPLHGRAMREMEEEARRIGNALEQKPDRLKQLRGIDICGVEDQQPLWVCAEILRKLRARSSRIAGRRPGLKLQPLRLTLHAGEDFRWLTSGMRAIAEPFHWELVERGDRIGHGIAVTLKPNGWWKRHNGEVIESQRIDRLQDLAFLAAYTEELPAYARNKREKLLHEGRTAEQKAWLAKELKDVATEIGLLRPAEEKEPDLVQVVQKFWRELGGRTGKRLLESQIPPDEEAPLHRKWLYRYFWNRSIQKRAHELIRLPVDASTHHERDLLIKARKRLIRELARWQIPIESNPSSNLVVGSLDAMASQDFLAQTVQKKRKPGHESLPWTISTDDPITFATSLADEYAYAWAGMVLREKKAYDPAHARALLDQAAATSMRTRFTMPNDDG